MATLVFFARPAPAFVISPESSCGHGDYFNSVRLYTNGEIHVHTSLNFPNEKPSSVKGVILCYYFQSISSHPGQTAQQHRVIYIIPCVDEPDTMLLPLQLSRFQPNVRQWQRQVTNFAAGLE